VRKLPLIAAAALIVALDSSAAKPPTDAEQVAFAKLSGKELIKQLADDKSRPRAFFELLRRAEPGKHADFKKFEFGHYNSRLLVCPQGKPQPPIYLVLYGFEGGPETESSSDAYVIKKPSELFPPTPPGPGGAAEMEPAICAFTAEGRVVRPFGHDTVLSHGTLADINGDEIVELVDSMTYGVEGGGTATILTVWAVKAKAEPLLTLLLNWEKDEWTYRLADQDGDGVSDIEAGPRTAAGFMPKAVWKWDRAKRAYVGPRGEVGDHFRIINGANLWKEFRRLKAAQLTFPKDADAIAAHDYRPEKSPTPIPSAAPTEPYRYTSLKDATDAELIRFMAQGKSEFYREAETARHHLPEHFWTLDAKAAALAWVEANRTEKHRVHYQIAIDDRDKAEPPIRCTIAFSDASARCYNAVDGHYFVRVDPDDSYVAFAGSSAAGVVFYNAVYDQPVFDLRICPLPYDRARQLAHVIWWLDRVRSRAVSTDSETERIITTGGGRGHFVMRVKDQAVIDHANGLGSGLNDSWTENYTPETFLNLASYLITNALPESLGQAWSQFEPTEQRSSEMREASAPVYTEAERKRLQEFTERFLSWFSVSQERISFPILSVVAQFAGDFGIVSNAPRLREIEAALPSPAPRKRTFDEISAEQSTLPQPFDIKDPKKRKRIEEQRAALDAESDAALYDDISGSPDLLRQALTVSLRKLAMVTDVARLSTVAVSDADDGQWALCRLAQLDRKRYADALETLIRETKAKWARQFYAALAQVDQTRAATIARELPADKIDALTLPAFVVLRETSVVPDEPQRLATIIKMLHNPKTDWLERAHAIETLVPLEDALRYPGREIDEALLRLFARDQADESRTFTLEEACLALARRGRTETFDRIVEQLQTTQDKGNYDRVLEALTYLAQRDPRRFNPRLVEIIRPHLSHTKESVPGLIWMIWSADLGDLEPELQRLATSGPDAFEDYRAHASGGAASAVTGRFHLARKILHLWSETDALARAKLLVIFTATEAEEFFRNPRPERVARMKADMNRAADELSPDAKNALRTLIAAVDSNPDSIDEGRVLAEMIHKATAFARTELRL
jgi:DNA-binding transcriptional ArsR family regulator